jgi:hypothetical protein
MGNERSGLIKCASFQDHLCKYYSISRTALFDAWKTPLIGSYQCFVCTRVCSSNATASPTAVVRNVLKQSSRPHIHYKCRPSRELLTNKLNPITSLMRIHVRAGAQAHKHYAFTLLTGKSSNSQTWWITIPLHCSALLLTHVTTKFWFLRN